MRRKFSYPMKGLPAPNANANPQRKKDNPPKQRSAKFFIKMFVTFLLRTDPASMKPKPALNNVFI